MITARIEATAQNDGEVHLTHLPCRKGDHVQAIVQIHRGSAEDEEQSTREEARSRFLASAKASTFRSIGPYPSRDELHERR